MFKFMDLDHFYTVTVRSYSFQVAHLKPLLRINGSDASLNNISLSFQVFCERIRMVAQIKLILKILKLNTAMNKTIATRGKVLLRFRSSVFTFLLLHYDNDIGQSMNVLPVARDFELGKEFFDEGVRQRYNRRSRRQPQLCNVAPPSGFPEHDNTALPLPESYVYFHRVLPLLPVQNHISARNNQSFVIKIPTSDIYIYSFIQNNLIMHKYLKF